jgi:hypothetical protein
MVLSKLAAISIAAGLFIYVEMSDLAQLMHSYQHIHSGNSIAMELGLFSLFPLLLARIYQQIPC